MINGNNNKYNYEVETISEKVKKMEKINKKSKKLHFLKYILELF